MISSVEKSVSPFARGKRMHRSTKEKRQKNDIPLAAEAPYAPIAAADVGRIQVVQIPLQAPEFVLARFHQYVDLGPDLFLHPLYIAVHVPLCVACA